MTLRYGRPLPFPVARSVCLACALVGLAGCATTPLHSARDQFRLGRIEDAETALDVEQLPTKDPVLFPVERGTIRQAAGHYEYDDEVA